MLITELLSEQTNVEPLLNIGCSDFINETKFLPLVKSLPITYSNVQKVKARKQKRTDIVSDVFNKAFETTTFDLRQRAIIAYPTYPPILEGTEHFYVFPINGYKFMYSKQVTNSTSNYKQMIDVLFEQFSNNFQALEIITDLLKFTYTSEQLLEGMRANSEIIIYGIPYYYAVRVSAFPDYSDLITTINKYNNNRIYI